MGVRGDERKKAGGCLARERQFPCRFSRKKLRGRERRERVWQCGVWVVARFVRVANEVEMVLRNGEGYDREQSREVKRVSETKIE
ncbi:hypothetical protein DVH24_008432 [Malus domestica]|uniref:Uncharacterized protein n=1 Tax=Malus domestica TaxID=3750 RepID=A0A498JQQ8_MALDO|nr:hypothetical protein DVH24_008432 [Malus domestica]